MDKLRCPLHGTLCMLKTGVKDGPNKGKSFYVCVDKQGCEFTQLASVPASHCLQHEDSMVELQALTFSQQQQSYRLFYRCNLGKKAGQRWCGNVPWTAPEKEKRNPLTHRQLQPSCPPPARNPFKAPDKTEEDAEWRRKWRGQSEDVEGGEKERERRAEEESKGAESGKYHGKQLPAGMKIKKRASGEEGRSGEGKAAQEEASEDSEGGGATEPEVAPPSRAPPTTPASEDSPTNTTTPLDGREPPSACPEARRHGHADDDNKDDDDDDDDVQLVSVTPAPQKTPPTAAVQKPITSFPGFQQVKGQPGDPQGLRGLLSSQLKQKKGTLAVVNVAALPDKGARLRAQVQQLEEALDALNLGAAAPPSESKDCRGSDLADGARCKVAPAPPQGGASAATAPAPPPLRPQASGSCLGLQLSQGHAHTYGDVAQAAALYGGRMTEDRLLAVKNATCEAIDHLHRSQESCPAPEAEVPDPKGIKVPLLAHQRRALAWLLWRETQSPCGGILADDMGLGKTLTMIALILAQKRKAKEEEEKEADLWLSKKDAGPVASKATLIICPASLVHHWKKEVERHVKKGRLSVCLYHGPNRERSARALAGHDVVVTTYSLVSKEVPAEGGGGPEDSTSHVPAGAAPLLRVTWARLILDEAHNIKNPKVQTSMAACRLRAAARWAVTGTPIQNNLLDMYSLLKFLRCSPFDEYKLWKAQVDNGSNRGRERLNILTRTLLLRRTKDQLDSSGKPLVSLPDRTCEVHRLQLSEDEQAVYDVVFAQSRSTLQSYLRRHQGGDMDRGHTSPHNPFDRVAQEFGMSQSGSAPSSSQQSPVQASSTVHILSLLLRLRQCCCHLSLLKKALDSSELQGDGVVLSLEEQLNALSLSSSPSSQGTDPGETVGLNGSRFPSRLFEDTSKSTKISAITKELESIRQRGDGQKSVIVSQWTSMLQIVAAHLRLMKLSYAVIDGTVNPKRRMELVEEFNTNPKGPQVMLVSLCAGGVGLNLVGGNHLFLMDMHWNPALEDQACDRIYRVGQSRDVTIHRFVCEATVEEKISTLQAKKKELAQNVLSGMGSTVAKLSLADLRVIFGV